MCTTSSSKDLWLKKGFYIRWTPLTRRRDIHRLERLYHICNTQYSKSIFVLGIHVHVYFSSNKWKGFVLDPYDVKLSFLVKRNSNCTKRTHNQPFWVKRDDLCNFCKKSNRGPEKSTGWPKSQNWLKWSKTPGLNFKIAVRAKLSWKTHFQNKMGLFRLKIALEIIEHN